MTQYRTHAPWRLVVDHYKRRLSAANRTFDPATDVPYEPSFDTLVSLHRSGALSNEQVYNALNIRPATETGGDGR
jgi:hypothetical protein